MCASRLFRAVVFRVLCVLLKIRFFWEPGAFDDKGEFVNDRLKCINKVQKQYDVSRGLVGWRSCQQDRLEEDGRGRCLWPPSCRTTRPAPLNASFCCYARLVPSSCNRYGSSHQTKRADRY